MPLALRKSPAGSAVLEFRVRLGVLHPWPFSDQAVRVGGRPPKKAIAGCSRRGGAPRRSGITDRPGLAAGCTDAADPALHRLGHELGAVVGPDVRGHATGDEHWSATVPATAWTSGPGPTSCAATPATTPWSAARATT